MPALYENHPNLFSAKYLSIFIKYLADQNTVLLSAFLKPGIPPLVAKNMIVKCAARNL